MPARLVWLAALIFAVLPLRAEQKAIFYYVPADDAWASLSAHADEIPIVAPQVFQLDESGVARGDVEPRVVELARRHHIGILPLLANEKPAAAHAVLSDVARRDRLIADLLDRCQQAGYLGLQIDLEGVAQSDSAAFTDFVRAASRAFHRSHLLLSVAVPTPLLQPSPGETYAPMYHGFAVMQEPYDLRAISRAADFITVMTYGQFGVGMPPGPVASYYWVEQSIRYALQFIPARKLSMGLGLWAYRWCGNQVTYSGYADVAARAAQSGAALRWHAWYRSPWFEFTQNGCQTVVWYENGRSLREKLKLVRQYRLHGFSAWRLGQEDPDFWTPSPAAALHH